MRVGLVCLVAMTLPQLAVAAPPTKVFCEGGQWQGVGFYVRDGKVEATEDSVGLPDTLYSVSLDSGAAVMSASQRDTAARVVNIYHSYVTLSYVYGGVHYTDTLYSNGLVISQNAKVTIVGTPAGVTFYQICRVLG